MRYRLVCFDAGFTMLSPRRTLADALTGVLAEHGRQTTDDELRTAWEAANRWFWSEYESPGNLTWTDDERINQHWRDYHAVMLRELGFADPGNDLIERILASQFSADSWEPYPDVVPMLEQLQPLRRRGELTVGVISDWGSTLRDIFVALEIDRFFDFVLASAAVGLAKPDAAYFRVALDRAGVRPGEAIMIGDSYRADVVGARAAGMDGVLLDRRGEADASVEAPIIRTLAELPPILEVGADAHRATGFVDADVRG